VQFLFGLDFTEYDWQSVIGDFWAESPSKPSVREYADRLISGVMKHGPELDQEIVSAVRNWSLERVGRIELNILRVALFEMRYVEDVPLGVAINEAIEVARRFGDEDAPRFVNGVLDRLKGD